MKFLIVSFVFLASLNALAERPETLVDQYDEKAMEKAIATAKA
jgi:hypothetical protein